MNEFEQAKDRKVWNNKSGTHLLTVSGLLDEDTYEIDKEVKEDGTIRLICSPESEEADNEEEREGRVGRRNL